MKKICFCFQIHQPYRLRSFRFFEIGSDFTDYEDAFTNTDIFRNIAQQSYIPANELMLDLLEHNPEFSISYSISGLAIEQMELYGPSLIESFQRLAQTGRVDFLLEPYAHSVSSLYDLEEFRRQLEQQEAKLRDTFGAKPVKILCNTELIYNGVIAEYCKELGLEAVIADGNRPFLGGRNPNQCYQASEAQGLKILLRNTYLSDLIDEYFSRYDSPEYPMTADKFFSRINERLIGNDDTALIYLNYESLGLKHHKDTGIFEFFKALPRFAKQSNIGFTRPSLLVKEIKAKDYITSESTASLLRLTNTLTPWRSNKLQNSVIEQLQAVCEKVHLCQNRDIQAKWLMLQSIDHLYYMDTARSSAFSPYASPYDAYTNYMNVFSDFLLRLASQFPEDYSVGINHYEEALQQQDKLITEQKKEIKNLKAKLTRLEKKLSK